jgi:tRNA G18 (ribose-2'-O)-methylase SpoU
VPDPLIHHFLQARRDPTLVVMEGLHALKHALRFGAEVELVVSPALASLLALTRELAPDLEEQIAAMTQEIGAERFAACAPVPPHSGVLALARRPVVDGAKLFREATRGPLVVLERPTRLANVGKTVRVAAGAGAAGVLTTGPADPWHPQAISTGAGLQFALPVGRVDELGETDRPLVALDPDGDELVPGVIPDGAALLFGSEREGLTPGLLARVDLRLRIAMEPRVSSLNLSTAVAVALYAWRWGGRGPGTRDPGTGNREPGLGIGEPEASGNMAQRGDPGWRP